MGRISPTDLPQPIYPSATVPTSAVAASTPSTIPATPVRPRGRSTSRAAIWAGAAIAVVAAVVVAVVALTSGRSGPGPGPSPSTTNPPGGGHAPADTDVAVDKLVGGVQLTNAEYRCVHDGIDARSGLAAGIESGSYDTSAAADVIAGCVSAQVVADLVGAALESSGVATPIADCVRTELASMSDASLAVTVETLLDGDADRFSSVLATEASFCFQVS